MDEKLTKKIQDWLNTPVAERDVIAGATLMLKLNRNQILYNNVIRRPDKLANKVEYELQKFLAMRLKGQTAETVAKLEKKVKAEILPIIEKEPAQFVGKRADHDRLSDGIKAVYVEQATLLHQMRDLHTKLRLKSTAEYKPCDRFQELDLLVEIAKKYTKNWEIYDTAVADAEPKVEKTTKKTAKPKKNGRKKSV